MKDELLRLLQEDLQLQVPGMISEEMILAAIEQKLTALLAGDMPAFFQLMYRLDIDEKQLDAALQDGKHGISRMAKLIFDRQLHKAASRNRFRQPPAADEDLKW